MGPLKTTEIGRHETINNLMEEKHMKNRVIHMELNRKQTRALHGRLPLNLQLFADGDDDGADDSSEDDDADDDADEDDGEEDKPEKKYTDADVDRMVKQRLARERKAAEKKARQQAEAEKLKNMSAAEKRDAEFEQMKARLASLEAEKNQAEMLSTASDILKDAGINVSSKLVGHLIAETADETKANVDEFVKLFNDAVNKGVKAAMKSAGSNPKRKGDNSSLTRDEIMKTKDPLERQKLIKENMNLFK